jgi:hypothetical protein
MRILPLVGLALLAAVMPAAANDLPKPAGEVVLTIAGAIENTNADGKAELDLAMLDALASRETTTATPWYDTPQTFKGPLGTALLDLVGAKGTTVKVTAINDYSAEIPMQDFIDNPVIFATTLNGETMSVRDKGPVFVVYPFDLNPDLYNEAYFGKSVWQVVAIEVY